MSLYCSPETFIYNRSLDPEALSMSVAHHEVGAMQWDKIAHLLG